MNTRYIIGAVVIIAFLAIAFFTFNESKIEYADFSKAKENGKTVQIIGSWDKSQSAVYNSAKNEFVFFMNDDKKNVTKVTYNGAKPNNFDIAPSIVIKGKYTEDGFHADEILTKCPSKYEGQPEELHRQATQNL